MWCPMLIALALAVVAALVFAAMWFQARRIGRAEAARVSELRTERTRLAAELGDSRDRIADLDDDLAEATTAATAAGDRADALAEQLADVERRAEQLAADGDRAAEQLAVAGTELEAAAARTAELEQRNAALVDDRDQLQARLDEVSGALSKASERPDVKLGQAAATGTVQPGALLQLELDRAERRWRHSVAPNPESDDSPFDQPGVDAARLAVEIEAAALREEVGAFITVEWKAEPITEPARAHLVLRMAQEILASAAREPEATHLVIEDEPGGDISMRLVPADAGSEVINLIAPPRIESDLVQIEHGDSLDVRVRAD